VAARPPPLTPDHAVGSVVESGSVNPHFTRVLLDVPDTKRLNLPPGADTAVGIHFGGSHTAPGRTYTVRRDDRPNGRITVDILMHGDGIGTGWASHVSAGDKVILAHANSWYRPPETTAWQLLVADMAGLPALARILDEAPRMPTMVIVEVVDQSDLAYLPNRPDVHTVPLFGTANGALAARVAAYARNDNAGYCWFAGEAREARLVRKYLRRELRWEMSQLDVMGYWRRHSADWDTQFAVVGADLYSVYTAALDDGKSAKDAMEVFDEALEQAGL
jgi:NADPH-dependent ferric siderophore reductase